MVVYILLDIHFPPSITQWKICFWKKKVELECPGLYNTSNWYSILLFFLETFLVINILSDEISNYIYCTHGNDTSSLTSCWWFIIFINICVCIFLRCLPVCVFYILLGLESPTCSMTMMMQLLVISMTVIGSIQAAGTRTTFAGIYRTQFCDGAIFKNIWLLLLLPLMMIINQRKCKIYIYIIYIYR